MESTVLLGLLILGTAAVLFVGWRRGRLGLAVAGTSAGLVAIWVATALAIETDYRDADGLMDCWPRCTKFQEAVKVGFWSPLPLLVLVLILFVSLVLLMWFRERAARRPG